MPKVKVSDINMYYEIHGEGEPLVMIPGASATTEAYLLKVPLYSEEYQVILLDNRGAGQTDKPDIPYTIRMMADDLAGLLGKIGVNSAHIYGESMGGMVAQEFAINYPERVKSLILISTYCGGPHGTLPSPSKRFDRELRAKMSPEELGMETLRLCVTRDYIDKHPDVAKTMMEAMVKMSEPAYAALRQAEAVRGFDTYEHLREIKAPTLIMAGDDDAAIPVENSSIIASMIPHAELVIFKDAGHILIEAGEKPDRIRLEFLRRHSATKA